MNDALEAPATVAPRRHLLLFSYFWPPFGGAGVQRALKLAQAAPEFGWRVSVVAAKARPADAQDPSLLTDDVAAIPAERVDHARVGGRLWRLRSWMPPDPYALWRRPALAAAHKIAARDRPDAVMSTSMPYTAHLAAQPFAAELGVPWLADLRDPWTDNRFHAYYQGTNLRAVWRRWVDTEMERRTYNAADLVSVTSSGLRDVLLRRWQLAPERVLLARNGYDERDFAAVPMPDGGAATEAPDTDSTMKLLFAGSMYAGYTIEAFFAAFERLLAERPDARIELVAHTQSHQLLERLRAAFPAAAKRVHVGPRVSHDEVIDLYGSADLLILATLDDLSIPGKLFEYIRSGTPILAFAVPGAESRALLADTCSGVAVPADDAATGAAALSQLYDKWLLGQALSQPDPVAIKVLERRVAYQRIFAALDRACESTTGG
jgi:glycosyltransferase involved in cell wall biosynthesis